VTSVNERDNLGNNLVPDYITSVKEAFLRLPWFYIGNTKIRARRPISRARRRKPAAPARQDHRQVIAPDV